MDRAHVPVHAVERRSLVAHLILPYVDEVVHLLIQVVGAERDPVRDAGEVHGDVAESEVVDPADTRFTHRVLDFEQREVQVDVPALQRRHRDLIARHLALTDLDGCIADVGEDRERFGLHVGIGVRLVNQEAALVGGDGLVARILFGRGGVGGILGFHALLVRLRLATGDIRVGRDGGGILGLLRREVVLGAGGEQGERNGENGTHDKLRGLNPRAKCPSLATTTW